MAALASSRDAAPPPAARVSPTSSSASSSTSPARSATRARSRQQRRRGRDRGAARRGRRRGGAERLDSGTIRPRSRRRRRWRRRRRRRGQDRRAAQRGRRRGGVERGRHRRGRPCSTTTTADISAGGADCPRRAGRACRRTRQRRRRRRRGRDRRAARRGRRRGGVERGRHRRGRPCSTTTTADISAGGADHPRRADRAQVAKHSRDIDIDEEDKIGVLRVADGGAAARNEADAAALPWGNDGERMGSLQKTRVDW